jgi:antirestriction protein ArdC
MNRKEVYEIARQAFEELAQAVEAGKSETLKQYLKTMGRLHRYSLQNTLMIHFQRHSATHVAGFWAWQRLGRHVKKNERGIAIMAPVVYRRKDPSTDPAEDEENEVVRAFKTAYVFDVSQTDGKPLPEFACVRGDPQRYLQRLEGLIAAKGIELKRTDALAGAEGASTGGAILVKAGLTAANEFSVLVHELAHEMLHRAEDGKSRDKKVKETEAEAVAYVVCQGIGLDVNTSCCDYIQLYDGDRKTLMNSLGRIQRTAAEILEEVTADHDECPRDVAGEPVSLAA